MSQNHDSTAATIRTFILMDLETTGLLHRQGKNCRIIEMCFVAVLREHLLSQTFPRVLNKLSLVFNPNKFIDPQSSEINGLSNDLLEYFPALSTEDYVMISLFINKLPPPVCFVAHNGKNFDFPLLRSELQRIGKQLPEDILCVDTLPGFRYTLPSYVESRKYVSELQKVEEYKTLLNDGNDQLLVDAAERYESLLNDGNDEFLLREAERLETLYNADLDVSFINSASQTEDELHGVSTIRSSSPTHKSSGSLYWRRQQNNTTPSKKRGGKFLSYKLEEIFRLLFSKDPISHRAENDVMNMLMCIHLLGGPFVEWMDNNCFPFQNARLYC